MMFTYTDPTPNNNDPQDKPGLFLTIVLSGLGIIGLIFVLAVMRAIVVSALWAWYVSPHFSIPELDIPVAFGISLLVGYLTHVHSTSNNDGPTEPTGARVANAILVPVGVYSVGWLGTLFM